MRDFAQFRPTFWTHGPGKQLRGDQAAVNLASWVFTSRFANMIGLYYLPVADIANELSLPLEEARRALQRVCEINFCRYDEASEYIWVINAARQQVAKTLKSADNRVKGVIREAFQHRRSPFFRPFLAYYWEAYSLGQHLDAKLLEGVDVPPLQGGAEGLASQDQEQDQETDHETEQQTDDDRLTALHPEEPAELEPGEPLQKWRDYEHMVRVMLEKRFFEATAAPIGWSRTNVQHVKTIAAWLAKMKGNREVLFGRVLDGFFRNDWARGEGFPLGALANNPPKYLSPSGGSRGWVEPPLAKAYRNTDLTRAFGAAPAKKVN